MLVKLELSFQIKKLKNVKNSNKKLRNSMELLNVSKFISIKTKELPIRQLFCFY